MILRLMPRKGIFLLNFLLSAIEYPPSEILAFLLKIDVNKDVVKSKGNLSPRCERRYFWI